MFVYEEVKFESIQGQTYVHKDSNLLFHGKEVVFGKILVLISADECSIRDKKDHYKLDKNYKEMLKYLNNLPSIDIF